MLSRLENVWPTGETPAGMLGMSEIELDQLADAFEHPERSAARRAMA